ncbi:MAG: hypothetical protein H0X66_20470 [Verrucomicrobia bacterium]|nr:hypothetical protein [Verrucomicrobiota bacterium]
MEQRKKLTLAERKQLHPKTARRRTGHQDPQDKPNFGKKGARGQSEGLASKVVGLGTVGKQAIRKKPGRAKQAANKGAHHKKPRRTE